MSIYRGFHWGSRCQDDRDSLQERIDLLEESGEALTRQVIHRDKEISALNVRLRLIEKEREELQKKLDGANGSITTIASQLQEGKAVLEYTMFERDQKIKELESALVEANNSLVYAAKVEEREKKKRKKKREDAAWQPYTSSLKKNEKKPAVRSRKIVQ